jgi:hypothetical protein
MDRCWRWFSDWNRRANLGGRDDGTIGSWKAVEGVIVGSGNGFGWSGTACWLSFVGSSWKGAICFPFDF